MKHLWRIIKFTRELWPLYIAISVFTVLIAVLNQLQPLFTKGAVDQISKIAVGGSANVKLVAVFAVLIFLSDLAGTLVSNIGGYYGDILSVKVSAALSNRYYKHLLSLPQHYFDTELSGKIINQMNRGINQISDFLQVLSNNFLQFVFSTIFALVIVIHYSWQVGLMLLVLYPIFVWMTTKTSNKWQNYQTEINKAHDIASGRFAESIGQVKVVKSFIQEARELKFFNRHMQKAVDTTYPQSRFWHMQDVRRRLVLNIIFLAIYAYIFVEAAHGKYTLGEMILLIQYAALIRLPIFSISFIVDRFQRAISNTKDYFRAMDEKPEITDHEGAQAIVIDRAAIEFKGVTFAYGSEPVLKSLDFVIEPDSKVALVGESGEGKTTITNLLMRLYEPQAGVISIDGQDINSVTQRSLRDNIGVVFQDPALFSGTINENISYANPKATKEEIKKAAQAANAHEFIQEFEKGYDTEIGERGLKLSGGQKQRIAIARAILKNAPILILDEATSSLDSRSESMVQEALERLMQGRTTIIIAHRLSTIQSVDRIITIKKGRVDEIGSPHELAASDGIYAQLLKLQNREPTERIREQLKEFEIAA